MTVAARSPRASDVLAKARYENFPVASLLLPSELRPHFINIYGFARLADDIGDEGEGDRLATLDWLSAELRAAYVGEATHPLVERLSITIQEFDLPPGPFEGLIEANRRDQSVHRYETFDELLEYCALSANPVGELVLRIADAATPERMELSDSACTGLQLVEFWQDLGEDVARDHVYIPLEDMDRFGYSIDDLMNGEANDRFVGLMRFEAERTRSFLENGRTLAANVGGRVGLAIRLFTAGGLAALSDLGRRGFDTFGTSARASRGRRAVAALRELAR
jgi:squalene synthase HpnC